jgi:anthranilate synthase component 2
MILLIDNYDSFTFNLKQYIEELGFRCEVYRNDALSLEELAALKPEKIVISPGPGNPDSAGISLEVIRRLGARIPVLGVCLGHQAIGQAFGGRVIRAPRPRHGKISEVINRGKGLFGGLPKRFSVARYHSLVVERATLPKCLEITAESADDGLIMGLKHRTMAVQGVQFHPESIATEHGREMLGNFLKG